MQSTSHPQISDLERPLGTPKETHARAKENLEALAREGDLRSRRISTLRLVTLLPAIALALVLGFGYLPSVLWWLAAALAATFVGLVVTHVRLDRTQRRLEAGISFHRWALSRIEGDFAQYPARGERFASDDHPYTVDLGIFGDASLFQLLDTTHTRRGEERLASWLSIPSPIAVVSERQQAIRELAQHTALRENLAVEGALIAVDKPNPDPMLGWAESEPVISAVPFIRVTAFALPIVTALSFGLALSDVIPGGFAWGALGLQWLYGLSLLGKIEPIAGKVSSREGALARYRSMLELIEGAEFGAPYLVNLRRRVLPSTEAPAKASTELRRLSAIVGFLDARQNEAFRLFTGPLLMWDVHCLLALETWQRRAGKKVRPWLEAIGEFEALSSLAGFAYDHPSYVFPQISSEPTFRARRLGHPLIAARHRVTNDVALRGAGTALLVTGSNMSGKSTLLRAMGINTVLALAGAPVSADEFHVGIFELRTSMWARDSLAKGVSHFYAELEKLKRVVDGIEAPHTLLFLLDEILQGTNSRERVIGARSVLRFLLAHGAMGAVSTHDVGLLELEAELDAKLDKVHFEEQITEAQGASAMTFDYQLRPGVVRSTNALRLMKRVGIDVELE